MNYQFVGYKHMAGTSRKTGNAYDFYEVSFLSPYDPASPSGAGGQKAETWNVSPEVFLNSGLGMDTLGATCQLWFDQYRHLTSILVT